MTREAAQQFERFSVSNAAHVKAALSCACNPYEDVYTMRRWNAQGFSVRKGSKAIMLPIIKHVPATDRQTEEATVIKLMGRAWVFCRCQVAPYGTRPPRNPAAAAPDPAQQQRRYELEEERDALQGLLAADNVRDLTRFINPREGEITRINAGALAHMGAIPANTSTYGKDTRPNVPWAYALDGIATERGFGSAEELKAAIEDHRRMQQRVTEITRQLGAAA